MAFLAKRFFLDFRRRLRRQEAPVGAILMLLLAVTTVAVTYVYY
jgi:hypothetical protein